MKIIGKTGDGKSIVSGLGVLYFRDGIPLSVVFDRLQIHDIIPSWNHLYQELKDNGMTHDRILHLLNEHVFESYGKEFRNVVISRLSTPDNVHASTA